MDKYDSVTLQEEIKDISELSVLELDYTDQEDWKGEAKKIFGKEIPLTSKSMQLIFSGVVKAGPDLEKMEIDSDEGSISVVIPHSDILSHEIDEESIEIQYIKNGVFNKVTPQNSFHILTFSKASYAQRMMIKKNSSRLLPL